MLTVHRHISGYNSWTNMTQPMLHLLQIRFWWKLAQRLRLQWRFLTKNKILKFKTADGWHVYERFLAISPQQIFRFVWNYVQRCGITPWWWLSNPNSNLRDYMTLWQNVIDSTRCTGRLPSSNIVRSADHGETGHASGLLVCYPIMPVAYLSLVLLAQPPETIYRCSVSSDTCEMHLWTQRTLA